MKTAKNRLKDRNAKKEANRCNEKLMFVCLFVSFYYFFSLLFAIFILFYLDTKILSSYHNYMANWNKIHQMKR